MVATAPPPTETDTPPPSPPQMPAILLDFPERTERLDFPDIYAPGWCEVVTNQPDGQVMHLTFSAALAQALRGWSVRLKDGTPAPLTVDVLDALAPDLQNWLITEFLERRRRPLVQRAASLPPPTTLNGLSLPTPTPS